MEKSLLILCSLGFLLSTVGEEGPRFDCELTIRNLHHALQDVNNWQILGLKLGLKWSKLDSLKRDPILNYEDSRKVAMLQTWWDYDLDASWEKLALALDQMDQDRLAAMIRTQCVLKSTTDVNVDAEDGDIPPTDYRTEGAVYVIPLPSMLAGTVGVILIAILLQVYLRCFERGHIVFMLSIGITLITVIAIYGRWSNPVHDSVYQESETIEIVKMNDANQYPQEDDVRNHDNPEATGNLQKSVLYCRNGEKALNNLPDLIGRFLGRSYNVQEITWLLVNTNISYVRAVGIYGSPAVGKTMLAIHAGHEISQCEIEVRYIDLLDAHQLFEHPESSSSVPLTSSSDPWASTSPVLFETLDDRKKKISLSAQGLLKWAKGVKKDVLLVLDNCDNILGIEGHEQKLKELITKILEQSSSTLRLIVTSRHRMAIPGLGFKKYYLRELDNDSAVQLLQLQSNHTLNENDSKSIAVLVDNNPLALHICAELVDETYPASQLIAELNDIPIEVLNANILPNSKKMVPVLYLSYKYLHNKTRSCGHHLSLFPGSFAETAAIIILSRSQLSNPKGCLEKLRDRSLIRPYELAGQRRYQHHRLVKEFFNYKLNDLDFNVIAETFKTSFQWYFSRQLYNMGMSYSYFRRTPQNEELVGRFEYDSHNFVTLLGLVAIHPPLSIESVYWTAYSLVNSDLVLTVTTEVELFRSLQQIRNVLLYNSNKVAPIIGDGLTSFWKNLISRLHTISLTSTMVSECRTLCMETFEFPSNVSTVIYDVMAAEYYVPRLAMLYDWLVCWFGLGCREVRQWAECVVLVLALIMLEIIRRKIGIMMMLRVFVAMGLCTIISLRMMVKTLMFQHIIYRGLSSFIECVFICVVYTITMHHHFLMWTGYTCMALVFSLAFSTMWLCYIFHFQLGALQMIVTTLTNFGLFVNWVVPGLMMLSMMLFHLPSSYVYPLTIFVLVMLQGLFTSYAVLFHLTFWFDYYFSLFVNGFVSMLASLY